MRVRLTHSPTRHIPEVNREPTSVTDTFRGKAEGIAATIDDDDTPSAIAACNPAKSTEVPASAGVRRLLTLQKVPNLH